MQHSYYIPSLSIMHGDEATCLELKDLYHSFKLECSGRCDGASRYTRNGVIVTVVLLRNIFSEKECVSIFEM